MFEEDLVERILTLSDLREAISKLLENFNLDYVLLYEIGGMLGIMGLIVLILYLLVRRVSEYRITIPTPAPEEVEKPVEQVRLSKDEEAVLNYLVERVEGSIEDITSELSLSSETVSKSVSRLEELGFVKRTSRSVLLDEKGLRYLAWLQERSFEREKKRSRETV